MFSQANRIQFSLPHWITEFAQDYKSSQNTEDRMSFVIGACQNNVLKKTGGPFAAAIFEIETGKLVSLGVNLVTTENLSILHAEIIAISLAQRKYKTFDLGKEGLPSLELVTSTEPCAMCLGAIPWSGVRKVVTAARDADARKIGFDEGPKVADWRQALADRGISVVQDIQRSEAKEVLAGYVASGGKIYNSRG